MHSMRWRSLCFNGAPRSKGYLAGERRDRTWSGTSQIRGSVKDLSPQEPDMPIRGSVEQMLLERRLDERSSAVRNLSRLMFHLR